MKTCEFDRSRLIDYIMGEIEGEIRREVEMHLQECSLCREEVSELKNTRNVLQKWQVPNPSVKWIFVPQKHPFFSRAIEWLRLPSLKVPNWAMSAASLIIIIFLTSSFLHTDIRINSEGFHFQTRFSELQPVNNSQNLLTGMVSTQPDTRMRPEEIILLVNAMLESRDNRLRNEYRAVLAEVLKNLQSQRAEDIKGILTAFAEYQGKTNYWMTQTNSFLKGIVSISGKEQ